MVKKKRFVKQDYRPYYDKGVIEKYRQDHPEEIEKLRKKLVDKNPKADKEWVEKRIEHELLPPVLERKIREPKSDLDCIYFSEIETDDKIALTSIHKNDGGDMVEVLWKHIESLHPTQQEIIKMKFGFHPHKKAHTQAEISEKLIIPQQTISRHIDKTLKILAEKLKKSG